MIGGSASNTLISAVLSSLLQHSGTSLFSCGRSSSRAVPALAGGHAAGDHVRHAQGFRQLAV
jgi:hypothetical protein